MININSQEINRYNFALHSTEKIKQFSNELVSQPSYIR